MQKSGQMVLKGVSWVHNGKIRSNGLERSHLIHNDEIRSYVLKESIGYTMEKSGNMVLKVFNCVHNGKIRSNGLPSCTQLTHSRPFDLIFALCT